MKYLRHPVAALVIFAVLTGLCINIYDDFTEYYSLTPTDVKIVDGESGNIFEQFRNMNLISGISELKIGILKLSPPESASADILGGLASVGIGTLKTVAGLVTTPFEIVAIMLEYYVEIPTIVTELVMLVVVYVAFILLSAYLRSDV